MSRFNSEPSPPDFFTGFSTAAVDSYGRRFRSRGIYFRFPSVASDIRRRRLLSTTAAVSYRRGSVVDPARGFFSIHFPPSVKSVFFFSFQTFFCEMLLHIRFVLPKIIYPFFFTHVDLMCNVIVERLHIAVKRRKHNTFKI
jgi:hypothetical protein